MNPNGKIISSTADLLIQVLKLTPAAANRLLGVLLIVASIWWFGTEWVTQSATNNERLVETLEFQTHEIIEAVKAITAERAREASIIKEILEAVDSTHKDLDYLRGRVDQLDNRSNYKSARFPSSSD